MSTKIRNHKSQIIIVLLLIALLPSCRFRDQDYVDFLDIEAGKGMAFRVIGQHETDLTDGLPQNCYLPGGTRVNDYTEDTDNEDAIRKTNSVTGAAFLQELLRYHNQKKVIEIVGTYPSINGNWDSIRLSGKVMLPKGRKPKRMILLKK